MASNADVNSAHAATNIEPKQEKLDDGLQFEGEQATFAAEPAPKSGTFTSTASDSDEDGEAFRKNPFLDPDVAEHWAVTYEKSQYECRHVFDPTFTWTEEEEKKLVKRLDWHVCLWAVSSLLKLAASSKF